MKIATDLTPFGKFVWCVILQSVFWIIKDHRRLVGKRTPLCGARTRPNALRKNLNKQQWDEWTIFENCNQIANSPSCSLSYLIFIAFFSLTLDEVSASSTCTVCLSNWRRLRLHFSIRSHLYIFMVILPSTVRWISSASCASANESTRCSAQHTHFYAYKHCSIALHPSVRQKTCFIFAFKFVLFKDIQWFLSDCFVFFSSLDSFAALAHWKHCHGRWFRDVKYYLVHETIST